MGERVVAFYARVSSEQQVTAHTIASQVAALRDRIAADGDRLPADHEFRDDGYSGATLVRPGLEHLRDRIASGAIDRLYVHSPDRLARKYAYQVLLLDEFQRAGVEVVFLNRELGRTPEDDLLLQVQGMVAEYERAKILERSRRGKRHAAQAGSVSVLSGAPYGYQYVRKQDGGGQARYEIQVDEARVVRQIFDWVGRDRLSLNEVCRRLRQAGERTRTGKTTWDRTTVWGILKNPAYTGAAAYGKTRTGPWQAPVRPSRGRPAQPRTATRSIAAPATEWTAIPVPAMVSVTLFETVHAQLTDNRQRARQGQRHARYLLQGLVCCAECGYAYYGKAISPSAAKGRPRTYAYYRCIGSDAYRFGGQRLCANTQVRTDRLDQAVWSEVRALLEQPERLLAEFEQRAQAPEQAHQQADVAGLDAQVRKLRQGMGRLIDSYADGLIEPAEFEPRIRRLRERIATVEGRAQDLAGQLAQQRELRLVIGQVEEFAAAVHENLDQLDWAAQRAIIRAVVKRVEIDQRQVTVTFRIGPGPIRPESLDSTNLPDCWRGGQPAAREYRPAWAGSGHHRDHAPAGRQERTARLVAPAGDPLCR